MKPSIHHGCLVARAAVFLASFSASATLMLAVGAAFDQASGMRWLRDSPSARAQVERCRALPARAAQQRCVVAAVDAAVQRTPAAAWRVASAASLPRQPPVTQAP